MGGNGADTISGGAGNDSLTGGTAADTISGGAGADVLDGGTEGAVVDTLTGGAGADTFKSLGVTGTAGTASTALGTVITDFSVAEDKLDLDVTTFGGALQANISSSETHGSYYAVSGTFVASTGVFTVSSIANGGFDTMIAKTHATNDIFDVAADGGSQVAILEGVLATAITTANII